MDRHGVEERGERNREEEEERGEHEEPRAASPVERPRERDAEADEPQLLEADLEPARPQQREEHAGEAREKPPEGRRAPGTPQFVAFGPQHVQRKRQHEPAVRHVLQLIAEDAAHAREHGGKPEERAPGQDQERPHSTGLENLPHGIWNPVRSEIRKRHGSKSPRDRAGHVPPAASRRSPRARPTERPAR